MRALRTLAGIRLNVRGQRRFVELEALLFPGETAERVPPDLLLFWLALGLKPFFHLDRPARAVERRDERVQMEAQMLAALGMLGAPFASGHHRELRGLIDHAA